MSILAFFPSTMIIVIMISATISYFESHLYNLINGLTKRGEDLKANKDIVNILVINLLQIIIVFTIGYFAGFIFFN